MSDWREYGTATQLVDIGPGQTVELFYSLPMTTMAAGRMGFEPQRRAGMVGFLVIMGVAALPVLAAIVASS